jgi:hypothetical protein
MGIALQSWERHGWWSRLAYWFWRDRKGIAGNLVAPLTNLLFLFGLLTLATGHRIPGTPGLRWLFICTLALSALQLAIRAGCTARIYGLRFACGVPVRAMLGNWLNCLATAQALWRYFLAKARRRPLVWLKTEHMYPSRAALMAHKRPLGEILVARGKLDRSLLETAVKHKPAQERLGAYLMRMGVLEESALYKALSEQQNLPFGLPGPQIASHATRALPASIARKWKVLPFRVASGELFLAGPELPSDEMAAELRSFSRLSIRYHLVTPEEFERMAKAYLPAA